MASSTIRPGDGWRIAVAGARGFVGRALVPMLEAQGHTVLRIGRAGSAATRRDIDVEWDLERGDLPAGPLAGVDAAINVVGENIGQRWSTDVKRRIRDSRVRSTSLMATTLASLVPTPRVFLAMSAVGYYGNRGEERLDESSTGGDGFLAGVVREWEGATQPAAAAGIRVVSARCGVILHPTASILERLLPIFRLGGGGRIGSGQQWLSWIGLTDALRALVFLLGTEGLSGAVNMTSPEPARNAEFTSTLAAVLRRPAALAVPPFAVRLLYGEMGEETVLAGQYVLPRRLLDAGFSFQYPELERALRHELALER